MSELVKTEPGNAATPVVGPTLWIYRKRNPTNNLSTQFSESKPVVGYFIYSETQYYSQYLVIH